MFIGGGCAELSLAAKQDLLLGAGECTGAQKQDCPLSMELPIWACGVFSCSEGVFLWVRERSAEKGDPRPLGIQGRDVTFACEGYSGLCSVWRWELEEGLPLVSGGS